MNSLSLFKQIIDLRFVSIKKRENLPDVLMLALIGGLYFYAGHQVALILNKLSANAFEKTMGYIYLAMFTGPMLATFIPSFSIKHIFLPDYLPIPKNFSFLLDMFFAFGRRPAIGGFSLLLGLSVFYTGNAPFFLFNCLLIVISSVLLSETVTNIITWRRYPLVFPLLACAIIYYVLIGYQPSFLQKTILYANGVAIFILIVFCRLSFSVKQAAPFSVNNFLGKYFGSKKAYLYKEVLLSNAALTVLVVAFLAKLAILFLMPGKVNSQDGGLAQNPLQLIFFTPVFIFGYVFNNTFGFFKSLFYSTWLYGNNTGNHLKIYMKLLLPFLIIDALISATYLFYNHAPLIEPTVFYLTVTSYFVGVSLISSVAAVRPVKEGLASLFKKNTSPVANLIMLAPIIAVVYYHRLTGMIPLPAGAAVLVWLSVVILVLQKKDWTTSVLIQLK